jgi:hypothetical protein
MPTTFPVYDAATLRRTHDELSAAPGWRRRSAHIEELVSSSFGSDPIVRARVRLPSTAAAVARILITDIASTTTDWNHTVQQTTIVSDDGRGARRFQMRTNFPWPMWPREDDFEQHAFVDERGAYWELSRYTQPVPAPPPRCVRTFVRFASKEIRSDGDGVDVQVLWHVALGGVLDRLPLFIKRRAVGDNLAHECERWKTLFSGHTRG